MAWHRLHITVFALLPALAAAGCDTQDRVLGDELDAGGDPDPAALAEDPASEADDEDPQPPAPARTAEEAIPCDWDQAWGGYACELEDGSSGMQQCILLDGEEFWTRCSDETPTCYAGDGEDYGCMGSICTWDGEDFDWYSWSEDDCNTPLVLNFERAPVDFAPMAAATFDLSTNGTCTNTAWPTSPWLALDRDGDGFIRSGAELFGNATAMQTGAFAEHGFAALAELDSNFDGKIDARDARFDELVLWSDLDDDRIGAYAELRPLSESTVVSIDLGFTRRAECDRDGNCGYERASFEYRQGDDTRFGEVVDVHLPCQ